MKKKDVHFLIRVHYHYIYSASYSSARRPARLSAGITYIMREEERNKRRGTMTSCWGRGSRATVAELSTQLGVRADGSAFKKANKVSSRRVSECAHAALNLFQPAVNGRYATSNYNLQRVGIYPKLYTRGQDRKIRRRRERRELNREVSQQQRETYFFTFSLPYPQVVYVLLFPL